MSRVLTIEHLYKEYPSFRLEDVSFSVDKGTIMGFIGRNGAGKTTALKAMLNLVHPNSGTIEFFGLPLSNNEKEIKQRIGYATGGISYYHRKRIKDIVAVTKTFYTNWDDAMYRRYMQQFSLDEDKKLMELSEGMKVKFNLTLALSHHAELLILDEPTSGLDPVSRDELLEIFLDLAADGVAILFSTHITSDLDKCADAITYIQNGHIIASHRAGDFIEGYRLLTVNDDLNDTQKQAVLGLSRSKGGATALIAKADAKLFSGQPLLIPDLQTIMVHLEKEVGK